MECFVCKKDTKSMMKGYGCCRECRPSVYEKRDKMAADLIEFEKEANGLNKNPENIRRYQEAPLGTIRNALLQCLIDRTDKEIKENKENTNE